MSIYWAQKYILLQLGLEPNAAKANIDIENLILPLYCPALVFFDSDNAMTQIESDSSLDSRTLTQDLNFCAFLKPLS